MNKEQFIKKLNEKDASIFYLFQNWLDGKDEDGKSIDPERQYISHTDGTSLGKMDLSKGGNLSSMLDDFIKPTDENYDRRHDDPIALEQICRDSSGWLGEIFSLCFMSKNENIPIEVSNSNIAKILFLELLSSFTYWGMLIKETKLLIGNILSADISKENDYYIMNLASAISVNYVNIIRNKASDHDLELFIKLTRHSNILLQETGYELIFVLSRLAPKLLTKEISSLLKEKGSPASSDKPTFRVKSQKALSNYNYLVNTKKDENKSMLENPNAMIGMVKGLASSTIAKYVHAAQENMNK